MHVKTGIEYKMQQIRKVGCGGVYYQCEEYSYILCKISLCVYFLITARCWYEICDVYGTIFVYAVSNWYYSPGCEIYGSTSCPLDF